MVSGGRMLLLILQPLARALKSVTVGVRSHPVTGYTVFFEKLKRVK